MNINELYEKNINNLIDDGFTKQETYQVFCNACMQEISKFLGGVVLIKGNRSLDNDYAFELFKLSAKLREYFTANIEESS